MAEMRLKASGSELKIISAIHLTSTQAQYDTCLFEFDGAWDGYSLRTAVFYSNPNNIKPMLLDEDNKCFIPWDSFSNSRYLYIGVYGSNGNSYLPTQFVEIMYQPGANIDDHNYPPTPGIYEQIITFMEDHAHGSITRDGKVGTVADRFLVTGAGGAVGVKTPQQVVDLVGVSNPNILHNWDFRNPVNQRNASGTYSTLGTYFYDRWRLSAGTVTLNTNHVVLNGTNAQIDQHIENYHLLYGKEITISVERLDGVIDSLTLIVPEGAPSAGNIHDEKSRVGVTTDGRVFFRSLNTTFTVSRVKAEIGPNSTLHLDPPMDHAVELPKCQRFFIPLRGILYGYSNTSRAGRLFFPSLKMRSNPTILNNLNVTILSGSGIQAPTQFTGAESFPSGVWLNTDISEDIPVSQSITAMLSSSPVSYLSADL